MNNLTALTEGGMERPGDRYLEIFSNEHKYFKHYHWGVLICVESLA